MFESGLGVLELVGGVLGLSRLGVRVEPDVVATALGVAVAFERVGVLEPSSAADSCFALSLRLSSIIVLTTSPTCSRL